MQIEVKCHEPVWRTTTIKVDVVDLDALHAMIDGGQIDRLLGESDDTEGGDTVSGVDSDTEYFNEAGEKINIDPESEGGPRQNH